MSAWLTRRQPNSEFPQSRLSTLIVVVAGQNTAGSVRLASGHGCRVGHCSMPAYRTLTASKCPHKLLTNQLVKKSRVIQPSFWAVAFLPYDLGKKEPCASPLRLLQIYNSSHFDSGPIYRQRSACRGGHAHRSVMRRQHAIGVGGHDTHS